MRRIFAAATSSSSILELTTDPAAADLRLDLQQHPFDLSNDLREHMGLPPSTPDTPLSPDDLRSISNDIARANTPSPLADMPGTRVFAPGYPARRRNSPAPARGRRRPTRRQQVHGRCRPQNKPLRAVDQRRWAARHRPKYQLPRRLPCRTGVVQRTTRSLCASNGGLAPRRNCQPARRTERPSSRGNMARRPVADLRKPQPVRPGPVSGPSRLDQPEGTRFVGTGPQRLAGRRRARDRYRLPDRCDRPSLVGPTTADVLRFSTSEPDVSILFVQIHDG